MSTKYENLNNIPDPISKLYLELSKSNNNLAFKFSNLISDFDANLTIRTNDIDRINNLPEGKSVTIFEDESDINSARVYSYEDAKSLVVEKFQNLLNKFISDCKSSLGSEYYSYISEIQNVFDMISKEDILRSGDNLSILETNVKNVINSVKKIKNDINYGAIKTTKNTGSSKDEIVAIDKNNNNKNQGGNFIIAAATASVCLCVAIAHGASAVGGECTNFIGRCFQRKFLRV